MFDLKKACDQYSHDGTFDNHWKAHSEHLNTLCLTFSQWRKQSDYDFGFVPLADFTLPQDTTSVANSVNCPIQQHFVKIMGCLNFIMARIRLQSQLNVDESKKMSGGLLGNNHTSTKQYPEHIKAYL